MTPNPFARLLGAEEKGLLFPDGFFTALLGGEPSKSGVSVNIGSALQVPTVLACVRVLAEGIAQLPLKLYRERDDGSKELAKTHPLYLKLWRRPNDWQTSFEWRESMMLHAVLAEGAFNIKSTSTTGEIIEILPVSPDKVRVTQSPDWGLTYEVHPDGKPAIALRRGQVMHLRGPSWNGYSALPMVHQAREAIGLAIAAQDSIAKLHANGARPSGILSSDGKLQPEQRERIKLSFEKAYAGVSNAFKTIVLDGGMKFTQMSVNPKDAQTEESRQRQVEEIARVFRVFPQMIGYADKTATYASAEQFFIAHVIHSLGPWIERIEQTIARDLLTEDEVRQGYYAKFSVEGLLRGDAKTRAEFYASGITNGWLTRNEARRSEDKDPIGGLDEPLVPLNMVEASAPMPSADGTTTPNQKAHRLMLALDRLKLSHLEEKVGRALSARNEGKLQQARDLIDEVLAAVDAAAE